MYVRSGAERCRICRVGLRCPGPCQLQIRGKKMSEGSSTVAASATASTGSATIPWVEKYRPSTIDQVAHQDEVVHTLRNALATGNVGCFSCPSLFLLPFLVDVGNLMSIFTLFSFNGPMSFACITASASFVLWPSWNREDFNNTSVGKRPLRTRTL